MYVQDSHIFNTKAPSMNLFLISSGWLNHPEIEPNNAKREGAYPHMITKTN